MKRFTEQLQQRAKTVHMTAAERDALRDRLRAYMEYHPLPHSGKATTPAATTAARSVQWWAYWRPLAGTVTVLFLVLVPVLAERSMPGDMLYAVKVKFNEEVRGSLSTNSYEEVEWATERLNRRLVEAQLLAQEGRLTDEFETEVAAAVREHSTAARDSIAVMRTENPEEAAIAEITLTALLDVHSSVLSARDQDTVTNDPATASVAMVEPVGNNAISDAIAESRGTTSAAATSVPRPSVDRLLSQIETETAKAYALLEQIEPTNATTVLDTVPRRLEDVDRKVQEAVAARDTGESVEARVLLTEALIRTRKVITYMQNWQLGSQVDIDRIVPIEYTAAELDEQLRFKEERLQVRYEYILSVVDEYATSTTVTEVATLLAEIPDQFASSTVAIENAAFADAGTTLDEIERALDVVVTILDIPDRLPDPVLESPVGSSSDPAATSSDPVQASSTASTSTATGSAAGDE